MKNNSIWNFLINPFTKIAGWQAFFIGIVLVVLSGAVGGMNQTWFPGVLDMRIGTPAPYSWGFVLLAVDVISIVLVMTLAALLVAKKFRFIDILGTMTLARAPMLLFALAGLLWPIGRQGKPEVLLITQIPILGILCILILIWSITLMYNGFKVSCNLKNGVKLNAVFIISVIIAETFSLLCISSLIAYFKPMIP